MKKLVLLSVFALIACSVADLRTADASSDVVEMQGLKAEVSVRRDARSIPYIEASNKEDLFFAQGFETARDRLWQMDLMRRLARGRVSELFGKAALAEDRRWRTFGFAKISEAALEKMTPELRSALDDYARGVNAYIDSLGDKEFPAEFQILQYRPEPWLATDTIIIGKILADSLSTTWWQDVAKPGLSALSKEKLASLSDLTTPKDVVLFGKDTDAAVAEKNSFSFSDRFLNSFASVNKEIQEDFDVRKRSLNRVGMFAEDLAASNNWVISGKRTIDGKAILANDPHLSPTAPGIWYLTHISAPGIKASGVTFPGVPGIILGHNEHIAWGATNVGPDVQDVYIEEFNDKNEYMTPKGFKPAKTRTEKIKYRDNFLSPELVEEELVVLETENGVVFREIDGKKLSLKWTAFDPSNQEFEAFFALNTAKDWKGFRDALRSYGGATQNFVYADVDGNIGWQVAGKIPLRRKGDGSLPYSGSTNDGDWIGAIDFEELPMLYNPPSGFIVTANQRIAGTSYKYPQLTRQFAGPWRARRIFDLISANPKISVNDVNDIQHDVLNIPLAMFAREIVKRGAASEETLAFLKGWDGKMTAASKAALLADAINSCVGNEIAEENKPANSWQLRQFILPFALENDDKLWLPKSYRNWKDLLAACDSKTKAKLTANLGPDRGSWLWGNYSRASFMHPLAQAPLIGGRFKVEYQNVDGSGQTPNVGDSVSMRHISKPANWDETRFVIPLGQSGNAVSDHWNDQFEYWRTGKPAILPFSNESVEKSTVSATRLKPKAEAARSGS